MLYYVKGFFFKFKLEISPEILTLWEHYFAC